MTPFASEQAGNVVVHLFIEKNHRAVRLCFSDHSQVYHSFGRSAVSLPRLRDAQTGDKNNYSSADRRAYLIPITPAIASILTSPKVSNGFCREPRFMN
jgi:hypothetical protein